MMQMSKVASVVATCAVAAVGFIGFAQDDLDDLLKDLDSEAAKKPAAKAQAEAPAAAAPKEEEPKEQPKEEAKAEVKEEVKVEAPAVEAVKVEAPKAEAKVEVKAEPVAEVKVEAKAEPAVAPAEPVAEAKAEAPKAEAPVVEEPKAEAKVEVKAEVAPAAEPVKADVAPAAEPPKAVAAAPQPKVEVEEPKFTGPDAELLENLRTTEKLRRTALDSQAQREITDARACMESGDYNDAVRHYALARKLLGDVPATKNLNRECSQGIAEGLYRAALQEYDLGRRDQAKQKMEQALDWRHPKARRVLEKWVADVDTSVTKSDNSDITHRRNDKDYREEREQIRKHLRRSRHYLAVKDLEKALEEVEVVLVNAPYDQEAIRLRNTIQKKRQVILRQERTAARDGMIADVDEAWRPVYAVNAAQLNQKDAETIKSQAGDDPERTQEQEIERRMKAMRLPTISFKPPATIIEAVDFFRAASKDYDRPDIPVEKRGFNFVLKTPQGALKANGAAAGGAAESDDFAANANEGDATASGNGLAVIPTITASDITFYEALKLVCDSIDYKFIVRGPVVMVMQKDMSTAEILSRKYNVPEAFMERVTSASAEMKEMGGFGNGNNNAKKNDDAEETPDKDWKAFFEEMGVKWPEGSSIKHVKSLGKLYVRNTRENLAEFEKVLDEMGGQPQLIEIETRFVEVSQTDLNSLGFEWILNSDYSLNLGNSLGRALGLKEGVFGSETGSKTISSDASASSAFSSVSGYNKGSNGSSTPLADAGETLRETSGTSASGQNTYSRTVPLSSSGSSWIQGQGEANSVRGLGVNAFGGSSDQQNGNRYLSTTGNHISGEGNSQNDQFMRVNAFLGSADLSMILHMLSQRSDTDLLSAPKIVTKSGENAVIKVVTEYIYPQDYNVQLQSSSSSGGGSSSGGSSSAILAVVEPQNFTMREVGVILDVTPTYNEANGGTIDLELKPQVVDEPTWKDYGMRIPFTGNPATGMPSLSWITDLGADATKAMTSAVASLINSSADTIAASYVSAGIESMNPNTITYYDAPMNQPFFPVRSIDSKVSITPGATVVMGGLITEQRKAMDDKIPFLGDLPYVGRLFRSHAEQTVKRNLLIFVTGRLITPAGRELRMGDEAADEAEVKPAPKAQ